MTASVTGAQWTWVIGIAGLGRPDSATPKAVGLSTFSGNQPASTWFAEDYESVIVKDSVRLGAQSTAPITGDMRQGTLSFRVVLDDDARPWLSKFLLGSVRNATGHLAENGDYPVTAGSVTLRTGEGANFTEGDQCHLGRSTYRVESIAGDVLTFADWRQIYGGTSSSTLATGEAGQLGQFLTRLEDWQGRAEWDAPPYRDDRVWSTNPFIRGREVLLTQSVYGSAGPETVWGWFVIESVSVDASQAQATIECRDVTEVLRERQFNERANQYTVTVARRTSAGGLIVGFETADYREDGGVWVKPSPGYVVRNIGVIQVEKSAFVLDGQFLGPSQSWSRFGFGGGSCDGTPSFGSDPAPEDPASWIDKGKAWELLVSDPGIMPQAEQHPLWCDTNEARGGVPCILSHPVDIVLAMLGGLSSNLPATWIVDMPSWMLDVDDIRITRDVSFGWVRDWPGLVAGMEGKPVKAFEFLGDILRSIGAAFAVSSTGRLTIRSLFDPASGEPITSTRVLFGRPGQRDDDLTADTIVANVGVGVAGRTAIQVRADDVYLSTLYPYHDAVVEIPAHGLVHPDHGGQDIAWYLPFLRQFGQLLRCAPMVWGLRVTATERVTPGMVRDFTITGIRSPSGILESATRTFRGFVLRTTNDGSVAGAATTTIDVLDFGFDATRIGPAAEVTSWNGTDELTLVRERFIQSPVPYYFQGSSEDPMLADGEGFDSSDVCVLTDFRGLVKSDLFTVSGFDESTALLTATASITGYTWADGDRVRLANVSDYQKEGIGYLGTSTFGTG